MTVKVDLIARICILNFSNQFNYRFREKKSTKNGSETSGAQRFRHRTRRLDLHHRNRSMLVLSVASTDQLLQFRIRWVTFDKWWNVKFTFRSPSFSHRCQNSQKVKSPHQQPAYLQDWHRQDLQNHRESSAIFEAVTPHNSAKRRSLWHNIQWVWKIKHYVDKQTRKSTTFREILEIGQLYAIAGNSQKVGLCQYIKEYSKMTQVEKRGIAGAYKRGCGCEVSRDDLSLIHPPYRPINLFRLICVWTTEAAITCRPPASGRSTTPARQTSEFACPSRAYEAPPQMPQTPPPDALGEEAACSSSAWTTHRRSSGESFCKLCRVACYLSLIDRRFIKPQLIYIFTLNFCSLVQSHQTRVVDESVSQIWTEFEFISIIDVTGHQLRKLILREYTEISQGWQRWKCFFENRQCWHNFIWFTLFKKKDFRKQLWKKCSK